MADGVIKIFIGMVAGWALLGAMIGVAFAKGNREKGAIIGTMVGIVRGCVPASLTAFASSAPKDVPAMVAE